jgi:ribosome-associated translation inhibitor RaiA
VAAKDSRAVADIGGALDQDDYYEGRTPESLVEHYSDENITHNLDLGNSFQSIILNKFKELEKNITALQKSHTALQKSNTALEKCSKELRVNVTENITALQKSITALQESHIALKESHTALQKSITALQKSTTALEKSNTASEKFYKELRVNVTALQKCNIELRIEVDLLSFDSALIYSGQLVSYVVGPGKTNSRGSGAFAAAMRHRNNFTHWGKNLIDMVESVYPDPGRRKDGYRKNGTQLRFALGCDRVSTAGNNLSHPDLKAFSDVKVQILIRCVERYSQLPILKHDVLRILRNHGKFLSTPPCPDLRQRSGN